MFTYKICPFINDAEDCYYQDEGFCHNIDAETECELYQFLENEED